MFSVPNYTPPLPEILQQFLNLTLKRIFQNPKLSFPKEDVTSLETQINKLPPSPSTEKLKSGIELYKNISTTFDNLTFPTDKKSATLIKDGLATLLKTIAAILNRPESKNPSLEEDFDYFLRISPKQKGFTSTYN